MKKNILPSDGYKEKYLTAFLLGFISFMIIIIPLIIFNGGYYIYYGDYNSQQIPFYTHAQEFVKTEGLGWDWQTDLGANFLGSYSFYLLGSPFFWLTLPLPNFLVVFAMPILLAMKFGLASMTAYAYIRKFVKGKNAALIGGMLYAFSGFQVFNIFFNHFHDVTAFFPLMLIAMEERVNNNRKGVFALSVALMGIINYFFFTGQDVFLIIYFLLRLKSPDFNITLKKFIFLAAEALIGVMIACVMLLPSALAILGNYRINERLYGQNLIAYNDSTRFHRIIQSFFMIPDVPARPNLFSSDSAKWASIGGYLPMFSMTGVIAFMGAKKGHWAKRLIIICIICAFIPILNSAFYMFNSSYYARWYYMPILIMALMTAQSFDDRSISYKASLKICAGILLAFLAISILPKKDSNGNVIWFKFSNYPLYFYITLGITLLCLILLWHINRLRESGKPFMKTALIATTVSCVVCTGAVEYFGAILGPYSSTYINNGIHGSDNLDLEPEENQFYRIDISENYDNYPMFWGLSSMRAFQSIVPGSIMDFYSEIGITRDVASRATLGSFSLRGLFSVKYYFDKVYSDKEDIYTYEISLPGFEYKDTQNGFYIYENKYYIPMGFAYNYYADYDKTAEYSNQAKERLLLRAVILNEEQAEKYSDVISKIPEDMTTGLSNDDYLKDCLDRKAQSCKSFNYNSEGFKAEIDLESSKLVFFSVPYDEGWEAYVNGEPADIENVSYGFMAVRANEGENVIEFKYRTPGLFAGALISLLGIGIFIAYIFIFKGEKNQKTITHFYDYEAAEEIPASKKYENKILALYHNDCKNRED